jgi:hypothetical protein
VSRIRLRYVNAFANRNRKKQRMRYYFRRRGQKAIPLPGLPGSDEFMAAYAAALNMVPEPVEVGASRTLPGTINALCVSYYRSIEWSQLNATTQRSESASSSDLGNSTGPNGLRPCSPRTSR